MDLESRWNIFFDILGAKRRRERRFDPRIVFWFPELQFFVLIDPGADAKDFAEKLHIEEGFPVVVAWGLPGDDLEVAVHDVCLDSGGLNFWDDCEWCINRTGFLAVNTHSTREDRDFCTTNWKVVKTVVKESEAINHPSIGQAIVSTRF